MFSDLVKVNSDKRFFRLHSFVIYWFNQSMCLSTVDEIGKLIEEQDEESANTVVVLLASNGICYARGLTVVLLR